MKELARWRRSYGDQGRLVFQPEYQPIHHSNEFLYAFVAPTVSKNYTYSKGLDTSSFFPWKVVRNMGCHISGQGKVPWRYRVNNNLASFPTKVHRTWREIRQILEHRSSACLDDCLSLDFFLSLKPRDYLLKQMLTFPSLQLIHLLQGNPGSTKHAKSTSISHIWFQPKVKGHLLATRSPTLWVLTRSPTAMTSPELSWPITIGSVTGRPPTPPAR